ncbi:hypothetical protein [Hyalangium sp.]|uniref:hypothetical protein n=1 Tax=Hyalangium sp. TaxID=2028555 RepID=UPI002D599590|nr:hypothetical protein [Hyalangium sp.]HYI00690.1 hypothetical protein [Hyalangium sp.]
MHAGKAKTRVSGQSPAQGWIATAKFGKRGIRAQDDRSTLTVHALNPERGTDWSISGRLDLLERALMTAPPERGETIYLTTAGWFGCATPKGDTATGLTWLCLSEAEEESLKKAVGLLVEKLPQTTQVAIGVDRRYGYDDQQELWWFQGGYSDVQATHVRTHKPVPRSIGDYRVLAFICGAIYGFGGPALDVGRDLSGTDVVLDAGHASLNRQWNPQVPLSRKRWAFHRSIRKIGTQCGAVFSHAHGDDYAYVRNCDNWIVYRNEPPFPGKREGRRIQRR